MEISSYLCIRFPQGRLFFEFYDRLMDRGQAASGVCFYDVRRRSDEGVTIHERPSKVILPFIYYGQS